MFRFTRLMQLVCIVLFASFAIISCQKESASIHETLASQAAPKTSQTLAIDLATAESITNPSAINYCGAPLTTGLQVFYKVRSVVNTSSIGNVVIGNDKEYLYITYNVDAANAWFIKHIAAYIGDNSQGLIIGSASKPQLPAGSLPIQQDMSTDIKSYTFRMPLSSYPTISNFKLVVNASAQNGSSNGDAWGVGDAMKVGNTAVESGAMSIAYTLQQCPNEMTCGYSQGYWFRKPDVDWKGQSVVFGNNTFDFSEARALWVPKKSTLVKAFFHAGAIQLSQKVTNPGKDIPEAIKTEYDYLVSVLSGVTKTELASQKMPAGLNEIAIKAAAEKLSTWICQNHCDATDTDACNTSL